jgi:predicted deacetylase
VVTVAARAFVIELHDLTPARPHALEAMLGLIGDELRGRVALLVVPNWYGRAPIASAGAFARHVSTSGADLVLHGDTHFGRLSPWHRFWHGVDDEAEFARLSGASARARLARAMDAFAETFGSVPRWFCAPRWALSRGALDALRSLGVGGLLDRDGITRLDAGVRLRSPVLWFDEGTRTLARSLAVPRRHVRLARAMGAGLPVRVALHPRDTLYRSSRVAVARTIDVLRTRGWRPTSLSELCVA